LGRNVARHNVTGIPKHPPSVPRKREPTTSVITPKPTKAAGKGRRFSSGGDRDLF